MRMNVFEMEGFLGGKCVPRDLKVNETNAEYLVRKFAEKLRPSARRWPKTNRKRLSQLSGLMRLLSWHTRSFRRWRRRHAGLKHAMAVTLEHVSVTEYGRPELLQ